MTTFPALFAIPSAADGVREWIVWASAILGGIVVIATVLWRAGREVKKRFQRFLEDLLQPKFDAVTAKVVTVVAKVDVLTTAHSELAAQNAREHAETAELVSALRQEFNDHMNEAAEARSTLQALVLSADLHVASLRKELSEPGLPASGPPPVPKHAY